MKALVLGGNGFIGSHVVDHLLAAGHDVRVFDRAPEQYRKPLSNVDYRLSTFDDIPALAEALEGVDVVYHLISTTVPSTSNRDPVYDIESNLVATVKLLNQIRDSEVSRVVYLSSGGTVYGIPEFSPIPENHPLRPICSYGVVKVAIENYIQMYHHLYAIDYVVLRASNPYGERQGHTGVQGVIGTFIGKVLSGAQIEVWGDGNVVRDFIHVNDLARLSVYAGESSVLGEFNAGSGKGNSIKDIVSTLASVSGKEIKPGYCPRRSYDVPQIVLDVSKAKREFSWNPTIGLEEGMWKTWHWMSEQNDN